jgi:hypothetical protein
MARLMRTARSVHRVLSYIVFAQVTIWIVGGLTFAVLPFDSVVKGGAVSAPVEAPAFPAGWMAMIEPHVAELGSLDGLSAHDSSQGLLMELQSGEERRWVRLADGGTAQRPAADGVSAYAMQLYRGEGTVTQARYLEAPEYRYLGLVDELYGRTDVWQVSFDDGYGTRLYFDGPTGRYLTVRNDFWVLYDAMWRLHIMDYSDGENFNNTLLRVFAPLATVFALSGLFLTWSAAQRALQRRRGAVRRAAA